MTSIEPITAEQVSAFAALIDARAKAENLSDPDPRSRTSTSALSSTRSSAPSLRAAPAATSPTTGHPRPTTRHPTPTSA